MLFQIVNGSSDPSSASPVTCLSKSILPQALKCLEYEMHRDFMFLCRVRYEQKLTEQSVSWFGMQVGCSNVQSAGIGKPVLGSAWVGQ